MVMVMVVGNMVVTLQVLYKHDLDGALPRIQQVTDGSGTQIRLTSTTGFPTAGTIAIANELITYTYTSATELTGITRGAKVQQLLEHQMVKLIISEQLQTLQILQDGEMQ